MDIVASMGFVISIIVLVVAIILMIYNIYKMSNLKVDDLSLADSMHDLLEDSFGDYAVMREYYKECQDGMVGLHRKITVLELDRGALEAARDAQDVLIKDMIAQLGTVTEARDAQGKLIQDMIVQLEQQERRLAKQEEGLKEQEELIVSSFNYIEYMHVEIEEVDIEIDDIPAQLREWIEERKEK